MLFCSLKKEKTPQPPSLKPPCKTKNKPVFLFQFKIKKGKGLEITSHGYLSHGYLSHGNSAMTMDRFAKRKYHR